MSKQTSPAGTEAEVQIPDKETLSQIQALVEMQQTLETKIELLETDLKAAKANYKRISEELIPDNLLSIGLQGLKLVDGSTLEIKKFYAAHISEERRPEAYKWLRQNKHDGIIKSEVISKFSRGEQREMKSLVRLLRDNHMPFEQKDTVHHATLKAWVRDMMENGEKLPTDLFGVHVGNVSVIKPPKA